MRSVLTFDKGMLFSVQMHKNGDFTRTSDHHGNKKSRASNLILMFFKTPDITLFQITV